MLVSVESPAASHATVTATPNHPTQPVGAAAMHMAGTVAERAVEVAVQGGEAAVTAVAESGAEVARSWYARAAPDWVRHYHGLLLAALAIVSYYGGKACVKRSLQRFLLAACGGDHRDVVARPLPQIDELESAQVDPSEEEVHFGSHGRCQTDSSPMTFQVCHAHPCTTAAGARNHAR